MKHNVLRLSVVAVALGVISPLGHSRTVDDTNEGVRDIQRLIDRYFISIDRADTDMAEQVFSNAPEVSFIHPRGDEHGRAQIEANLYRKLMGKMFSERRLTAKDVSVHVYGDTAWAEFSWDFVAKVRKDGSAFHSEGRETDIFRRENGQWRIVHVHYSGPPVTGNLKGF